MRQRKLYNMITVFLLTTAIISAASSCTKRVVIDADGNRVEGPRADAALALSDFSRGFIIYSDTVIALADADEISPELANQLFDINEQVLEAVVQANAALRDASDDQGALDSLRTIQTALRNAAQIVPASAAGLLEEAADWVDVALEAVADF